MPDITTNVKRNDIVPPQADDFEKVVELVFRVGEVIDNYKSIAEYFSFTERQSSYYRQAAEMLGLVESKNKKYELTDLGEYFIKLSTLDRMLFLINQLRSLPLIELALNTLHEDGRLSREQLVNIICDNSSLSRSTATRRASTLFSWIGWISEHTKAFQIIDGGFISDNNH